MTDSSGFPGIPPGILSGIRVLDFTQYLAGPTTTRLMAEMGAEVIKVEHAPDGDPARILPVVKDRRSGYFVQQNRGKKSLCLDLKRAEAVEILHALLPELDVVIENYGLGVMDRRGLSWEAVHEANPKIVMASISAFGRTGPFKHKTGYDFIAQAFSGMMHMTGAPDGPPYQVGYGIADQTAGVHAFAAIGYALFARGQTGRGQYIDLSMVDALYHMHEITLQGHDLTDGALEAKRAGSHHPLICPVGAFKSPGGYIVILALQRQWKNVCEALGRPDLLDDPRFAEQESRGRNQTELIAIIEDWMAAVGSDEAILERLEEKRVPCAPVLSPTDGLGHPYFEGRNMIRRVPDPIFGELTIPGFPFKFSEHPELPELQAPLLGQHNEEVLTGVLGFERERVRSLEREGVLHSGDR
jgi:crotonobetainyl-CoA:carnitine CoA-transferase CaiB-like acyl-CoA transferase